MKHEPGDLLLMPRQLLDVGIKPSLNDLEGVHWKDARRASRPSPPLPHSDLDPFSHVFVELIRLWVSVE